MLIPKCSFFFNVHTTTEEYYYDNLNNFEKNRQPPAPGSLGKHGKVIARGSDYSQCAVSKHKPVTITNFAKL